MQTAKIQKLTLHQHMQFALSLLYYMRRHLDNWLMKKTHEQTTSQDFGSGNFIG